MEYNCHADIISLYCYENALAIINDTAVLVPGEEGLKDIRLVEAIYKAAQSGKTINLTSL